MPYSKFNDDPLLQRVSQGFKDLCAAIPSKKMLRLIDQCFVITNQANTEASFCGLSNFIYPVDSFQSINMEVCAGQTLVLFDNGFPAVGPSNTPFELPTDINYARGIILMVTYPTVDKNGADIILGNRNVILKVYAGQDQPDDPNAGYEIPLGDFFSHFTNPYATVATNLINRIEIINPNTSPTTGFSVVVTGLVIYSKNNADPATCSC